MVDYNTWDALSGLPRPKQFKSEDDLAQASSPIAGLYLLRNGNEIVYVGQSANIAQRIRAHRRDRTKTFTRAEFYQLDDEPSRLQYEGILILALLPAYNRALSLGIGPEGPWELPYRFGPQTRGRRRPTSP